LTTFFLVVDLKTQAKTTKSTTPTLQKHPLYNCLLVLLLHTAAVTKHWGGKAQVWEGAIFAPPPPQRKTTPELHSCNSVTYLLPYLARAWSPYIGLHGQSTVTRGGGLMQYSESLVTAEFSTDVKLRDIITSEFKKNLYVSALKPRSHATHNKLCLACKTCIIQKNDKPHTTFMQQNLS